MRSARWLMLACGLVAGLALLLARPGVAQADTARFGPLAMVAGAVQSCPSGTRLGTWIVGGQRLQVVEGTVFVEAAGPAGPGAEVMVLAHVRNGGELQALIVRTQTQAQAHRAEAFMAQMQRVSALALRLRAQGQTRAQQQLQTQEQARNQLQSRESSTHDQAQLQGQAQEQTHTQLQTRDQERTQDQTRVRLRQGR